MRFTPLSNAALAAVLVIFLIQSATGAEIKLADTCAITVTLDLDSLSDELRNDPRVQAFVTSSEQLCREYFIPVQQQLFPHDPLPRELSTRLKFIMQEDGIAWAGDGEISANLKWFLDSPEDLGAIYHELVHIVQAYPHNEDAGWVVEGIADWARYFVYEGRTLDSYRGSAPGHYRDAYTNAARFLDWLRQHKNADIVTELNARLRAGTYNPVSDWPELCGAGLDALWHEYAAAASTG